MMCCYLNVQFQGQRVNILDKLPEISVFRRGVDVTFAILGRNEAYVGLWLSKFRDDLSIPSSMVNNSIKLQQPDPWSGPVRLSGNVSN